MKAAIFDLDGTLLDSMCFWENVCFEYLKSKGIAAPDDLNVKIFSLTLHQAAQYVSKEFVPSLTAEEIIKEWDDYVMHAYEHSLSLKPSVYEYLSKLKKSDVRLCIATLTDKRHVIPALVRHRIFELFEFIITVEEVNKNKHFPDIYLKAAEKLEVDIMDCVVFEDTLYAVKTARKAGFSVYGIYDMSSQVDRNEMASTCDRYIEDFGELL